MGQLLKKWGFWLPCCWVSEVVSQDTWPSQNGISSIQSLRAEETSKMWWNTHHFADDCKLSKSEHVFDFFSALGDRIELVSFWEGQARVSQNCPKLKSFSKHVTENLIPISRVMRPTKKNHFDRTWFILPPKPLLFTKIYKGFKTFIKEKYLHK